MTKRSTLTTTLLAGALVLGVSQFALAVGANAAPVVAHPGAAQSLVQNAQIYQRGRTPRYPYSYTRRPGGWSTYFGFVPYAWGDLESQALQRVYPQSNYPPSMRAWTPQSGF